MRIILSRIFLYTCIFQALESPLVQAGLNHFTEIDSFGRWTIEQKFNPEDNKIECRASMKGYGTWFGERIRLDKNGEVIIPKDLLYEKKDEISLYLNEVRNSLSNCASGLLYIRKKEFQIN